jgi:hypothetical protein
MRKPLLRSEILEGLYAIALRLYPAGFRAQYGPAMNQTFRDAIQDVSLSRRTFLPMVLMDLATSLTKEHISMIRETFLRPALVFNAVVLAGISTVLALALYSIPQQVLRQGANDPQIQLAGDLASRLETGIGAPESVPVANVDIAHSLAPFVIAFDDQGKPLASQAQLSGKTPVPPSGVFDSVRQHGESRISWQPQRGVRIAAVIQRVNGSHPGFVLAGRNMREVEAREQQVEQMAGLAWITMLGLIFLGTAAFGWYTRPKAV